MGSPWVLEFLGGGEAHLLRSANWRFAIIDRLQQFLLELGKGFLFEVKAMSEPRRERIVVSKTAFRQLQAHRGGRDSGGWVRYE